MWKKNERTRKGKDFSALKMWLFRLSQSATLSHFIPFVANRKTASFVRVLSFLFFFFIFFSVRFLSFSFIASFSSFSFLLSVALCIFTFLSLYFGFSTYWNPFSSASKNLAEVLKISIEFWRILKSTLFPAISEYCETAFYRKTSKLMTKKNKKLTVRKRITKRKETIRRKTRKERAKGETERKKLSLRGKEEKRKKRN